MQAPQPHPLPVRRLSIAAECAEGLASLQPERPRSIVQLHRSQGNFQLQEFSWGQASIQRERWGSGVRLQQGRPTSYVAFAVITRVEGDARWMGSPFETGSILRIAEPWEAVTSGPLEYLTFAVGRSALDAAEARVLDPHETPVPFENRIGRARGIELLVRNLRRALKVLPTSDPSSTAFATAEEDLIQLAMRIDRSSSLMSVARIAPPSVRTGSIRRIDAYLEASGDVIPSIPTLCDVAGVSERTLEYAFRERFGLTPVRYLKLRRLNLVHRRLETPDPECESVTEVALACGFYDLGRFAGDYRELFDELPSETLARSRSRSSRRVARSRVGRDYATSTAPAASRAR